MACTGAVLTATVGLASLTRTATLSTAQLVAIVSVLAAGFASATVAYLALEELGWIPRGGSQSESSARALAWVVLLLSVGMILFTSSLAYAVRHDIPL